MDDLESGGGGGLINGVLATWVNVIKFHMRSEYDYHERTF